MKASHVETAKRITECKITDDIEGREVKPVHKVEGFVVSGHPLHVQDELVDVTFDDVFLFNESLLGE